MPPTPRGRFQLAVFLVAAVELALGLLAGGGVAGYAACVGGVAFSLGLVLDLLAP